jgi:hypothetical protein
MSDRAVYYATPPALRKHERENETKEEPNPSHDRLRKRSSTNTSNIAVLQPCHGLSNYAGPAVRGSQAR